ncbi:hypothetical protein D3C78_1336350 [compost metagenome]
MGGATRNGGARPSGSAKRGRWTAWTSGGGGGLKRKLCRTATCTPHWAQGSCGLMESSFSPSCHCIPCEVHMSMKPSALICGNAHSGMLTRRSMPTRAKA